MRDVESDLGFYHGPEAIPRTFPMAWAAKFDPLLLIPAILRLVKRVLEQINNLGVCFCFFLLTASQSITDELRETERVDRNKHNDCQSSVPAAPI